jgi:RimJ/RimL family protein N-acetyltransferase
VKRIVIGRPVVDWTAAQMGQHVVFGAAVGFGIEQDGEIIAGVVFDDYNGVNINMHVASSKPRWMTRELLWMVFDYAFNQAKVNRITGLVGEGNTAAREFDEHIGFTLETTLKAAHPSGDLLIYRMFRDECKWLKREFHGKTQRTAPA